MKHDYVRPSVGWIHVHDAVYDRIDGLRVHIQGVCRLPDGRWFCGNERPESSRLDRFIRINGGNRKRGVMAWAADLVRRERAYRMPISVELKTGAEQ